MKKIIFSIFLISSFFIFWNNLYGLQNIKNSPKIGKIEVLKSKRVLRTYHYTEQTWQILKEYKISLGRNAEGKKEQKGDHKTPEGNYFISRKNPNSQFFLSLQISYPNEQDKHFAKIKHVNPGNDIMIHGLLNGLGWIGKLHLFRDWTKGCIALTNSEIKEIYEGIEVGTPIIIKP